MSEVITINNKNYTVGLNQKGKRQEIVGIIDEYMGYDFSKYIDEHIGELEEKSEELNEMCSLLDELYDCFAKIKEIANNKYKKMPKWGKIAEEGMNLINNNR